MLCDQCVADAAVLFAPLASPQDMGCMGDHGAVPLPPPPSQPDEAPYQSTLDKSSISALRLVLSHTSVHTSCQCEKMIDKSIIERLMLDLKHESFSGRNFE